MQQVVDGAIGFGVAGIVVAMAALLFSSGALKWGSGSK
jgi:hypothetical protein